METINNNAKFVDQIELQFPNAPDLKLIIKRPMPTSEIVTQLKEATLDMEYLDGKRDENKNT